MFIAFASVMFIALSRRVRIALSRPCASRFRVRNAHRHVARRAPASEIMEFENLLVDIWPFFAPTPCCFRGTTPKYWAALLRFRIHVAHHLSRPVTRIRFLSLYIEIGVDIV
jgi:hypothetical protein